jgi:flavin-dependent dehydrogenase
MLVGDAASLIDPLTGEGIANAMVSGRIAAKHAADALTKAAVPRLDHYDAEVWATLGPTLNASYRMQKLLTHPVSAPVIALLMRCAAASPQLHRAVVGLVQGDLQKLMHPWGSVKARVSTVLEGPRRRASDAQHESPVRDDRG